MKTVEKTTTTNTTTTVYIAEDGTEFKNSGRINHSSIMKWKP